MKILIGYDGSECADAALDDLRRAGLPPDARAVVLSVADVFLPPPVSEADDTFPFYVPPGIKRAHERAARALGEARAMAERTASRVKESFPGWHVRAEATAESPAWALVLKAAELKSDLIVVGAHGHTVLGGRLILGSVSQRVLYEARCSVRVARDGSRAGAEAPVRVVIGMDGSPDAEAAVAAVAARAWPAGSEIRLVSVLDTFMSVRAGPDEPSALKWVDAEDEKDWEWVRGVFEPSAEKLRRAGLNASVELRKGNPKSVLVEEAEGWGADCVFVGARGMRGAERLLMGSVSAAVAARAHCSVEVVRPAEKKLEGS
ncbi:MAG TPA: universal stress protein [Pyrinomonadaceae bacterium]